MSGMDAPEGIGWGAVRIYIWHGYLLTGTGSNEYSQALARTLARQGHDVTVFCQDPQPPELPGVSVVRPELPGRMPVFVLDRYADAVPALLGDMDPAELDAYVAANVAAIRACGPADLLITNHLLMGGPVGAASGLPFVVKAHGSELEFAMRGEAGLCSWAEETLAPAAAVIAGSRHIESVIDDLLDLPRGKVHVIPPGVDTEQMRPRSRAGALQGLLAEAASDAPNGGDERRPDDGNAELFRQFFADPSRCSVLYVGKISEEKGVPLLLDAVSDLDVDTLIVGFGPLRRVLEEHCGDRVFFTGPLQHRHLRYLWPLVDVSVVPSVFPEAFGMVAAEAASCACPPLVADQTGLAEIAAGLRRFYPDRFAELPAFVSGDVSSLTEKIAANIALSAPVRREVGEAARAAVEALWSWDSVARRITALVE